MFMNLRWAIMYWLSRVSIRLGRYLPSGLCYAVSGPIADLVFLLPSRHRRVLVENLTRVVGPDEATPTARRVFRSFARYVIDLYQTPGRGHEALKRRLQFDDWRRLDEALDAPNGTLFVTLHLGQIDLGAGAIAAHGHQVNVIAEPLSYKPMNNLIQGLRRQLGMKVIPAKKARLDVFRCLNRGEVLVMLFDAVEPGQGTLVDFCGAPAEVATAPARIALRTGARILPAVIGHDGHRLVPLVDFDLRFESTGDEEADVQSLTQALARSFEPFLRRFPDQWFAFRPVWQARVAAGQPKPGTERWMQISLQAAARLGVMLPRPVAYGLARLAGDVAYRVRASTRSDVEDNMRHVLGPDASDEAVSRVARDAFRNVARYYVDLIRVPQTPPQELLKQVRLHGFDKLRSRLDTGQSVVVATAHLGNPEMAVQVAAILGVNTLVLAEPLQPPSFAKLMQRLRTAFGTRYEDVGYRGVSEAIRFLRAGGGCLAITCDRDIQGNGAPLPFFGTPTPMPLGAVDFAARTGAVLMPGYCRREGSGFDLYFEDPLDLVDTGRPRDDALVNARALLGHAETWLRADPGQWMVLDRIWKPVKEQPAAAVEPPITTET
ncbi:MAG: hypothetical protein GEU75_12790 [Dehalococcoidia bacterium]|nr:hypothetical protein [Dehalococcoidia bacterium]